MKTGNPDISLDIYHAIVPILHAEKTPTLACADIMRIPLEQVVDGSVYQFELVRECERCEGVGLIQDALTCHNCIQGPSDQYCSEHFDTLICEACTCTDGKTTKRISHYDLVDADIAHAYVITIKRMSSSQMTSTELDNGSILRAIKIREVSK